MSKIGLRMYTIPEYEEEQNYLSKMHRKGWKFVRYIIPCFYLFEKCEPANVSYQLDYNEEGLKDPASYYRMYEDCGWEHICNVVGYSYFRKEVDENKEEEIFNDIQSKIDMTERVFRGRMFPCLIVFIGIICPQLFTQFHVDGSISNIIFIIYLFLFAFYLIMFIKFYVKRHKLRKKNY